MTKTISIFNNKGGVGKTTIIWNVAVALADQNKNVLLIDFDPQCNLSIACLGDTEFAELLDPNDQYAYSRTIKNFALPYIQKNTSTNLYTSVLKSPSKAGNIKIIPGDFWLNTFSDVLNVGTDVISGAGLYRFLLPHLIATEVAKNDGIEFDYVLIDLPPSFSTLVRSALYCSDYFIVPCTPDLFSAYCIGLIGEMLPDFIVDWNQGVNRYLKNDPNNTIIKSKGQPKFGGWIYNGFDTRKHNGIKTMVGADKVHYDTIQESIQKNLLPQLQTISQYSAVPTFATTTPIGEIEDLNVMAPDSIFQNVPIKYLPEHKPTNKLRGRGNWASNQVELMQDMADEYNKIALHIINNF